MAFSTLAAADSGLYCRGGDFYIDPWRPVPYAVVTHANCGHVSDGCGRYLSTVEGEPLLRMRFGPAAEIETLRYGQPKEIGGVRVSFHPAGHLYGSAQVRLEQNSHVTVFSGHFKRQFDPTCAAFEPLKCDTFVTESTFALPIFRFPGTPQVMDEIHSWWRIVQAAGRVAVLFVDAVGKAQRILAHIDTTLGPVYADRAVEVVSQIYRECGVTLPETKRAEGGRREPHREGSLVLAPLSARSATWLRRFGKISTGIASGWMRLRGVRRRLAVDRGFPLSNHADWPDLLATIRETGATRILPTHGYAAPLARYLQQDGIAAEPIGSPRWGAILGRGVGMEQGQ
jgi:putative mRNA 3-end processing factor